VIDRPPEIIEVTSEDSQNTETVDEHEAVTDIAENSDSNNDIETKPDILQNQAVVDNEKDAKNNSNKGDDDCKIVEDVVECKMEQEREVKKEIIDECIEIKKEEIKEEADDKEIVCIEAEQSVQKEVKSEFLVPGSEHAPKKHKKSLVNGEIKPPSPPSEEEIDDDESDSDDERGTSLYYS